MIKERTVDKSVSDLTVVVAGETLVLLHERAVWWPARRTLMVADVHFGKSASFRHHGIAIPAGTTEENLVRLDGCLARYPAERLLCLGDLTHARSAHTPAMNRTLSNWRSKYPELKVQLVIGNHDRHAGVPDGLDVECHDADIHDEPFVFAHHPRVHAGRYLICGHVHPAVRVSAHGDELRLPAFTFGEHIGILPAFGAFTGMKDLAREANTRYFVVAEHRVIALP